MRRCMSVVVLLFVVIVFCSPVLGMEGEASGTDAGAVVMSPKMVLAQAIFDILWKAAIPLLFAWLAKRGYDEKTLAGAKAAVEMGVTHCYENFVRTLKKDKEEHPDGKLTEKERTSAKEWAITKAKEFATGGSKRILLKWGARGIGNLVEKIVARRKKRKQRNSETKT